MLHVILHVFDLCIEKSIENQRFHRIEGYKTRKAVLTGVV